MEGGSQACGVCPGSPPPPPCEMQRKREPTFLRRKRWNWRRGGCKTEGWKRRALVVSVWGRCRPCRCYRGEEDTRAAGGGDRGASIERRGSVLLRRDNISVCERSVRCG